MTTWGRPPSAVRPSEARQLEEFRQSERSEPKGPAERSSTALGLRPYAFVKKKQNGRADPLPFHETEIPYFLLTAFFSSAPGVNFATLRAAILMVAPVCGLRPFRAFL